jgi:tryptophan synthase alpha chain
MNLSQKFNELRQKNETALIAYTTGGFPSLKESMENIKILSQSGADIIEVGVPFSDPIADGPVIQEASHIALQNGATLKKIISEIKNISVSSPLVMMSYINPLLAYGKERLFEDLQMSPISGVIIPDLPIEASEEWIRLSSKSEIDLIFFITPTSTVERMKYVAEKSRGFIYCISITGTTGVRNRLPEELFSLISRMKIMTTKPLAVGFGISTPEHVKALAGKVAGVIIGSRFIQAIKVKEDLSDLVGQFKKATQSERSES